MTPARVFACLCRCAFLIPIPCVPAVAQRDKPEAVELAEMAADAFFPTTASDPAWKKTVRRGSLMLTNEDGKGGGVWFIDQDPHERCVFHLLKLRYRIGESAFQWDESAVIDARGLTGTRPEVSASEVTLHARKPALMCWRFSPFKPDLPAVNSSSVVRKCDNEHVATVKLAARQRFEDAVRALRDACGWR